METLEQKQNAAGVCFRLSREGRAFYVFKRCANYSAHVHGGVSFSWRYTLQTTDEAAARAQFAKHINSKVTK